MNQTGPAASQPQRRLRTLNDRAFCELLTAHSGLTRKQLARSAGLSVPAATKIVSRLQADGIVVLVGEHASARPGPKADLISLADDLALVTAVEVVGGAVRVQHHNLSHEEPGPVHTLPLDPAADLVDQLAGALRTGQGSQAFRHRATCVAIPGVLDPSTADVLQGAGLEQWTPGLSSRISARLDHPVEFDNDANLLAAAEHELGVARGLQDFLLVSYGAGVGAGVVMDGRVRRGTHGAAGEVGLLPTRDGTSHFRDVVGAWIGCDGTGLPAGIDWPRLVSSTEPVDWGGVAAAIGRALTALALVLDPEAIVLAGEVARRGGEPLRAMVERHLHDHLAWHTPDVLASALAGNAVLVGASLRGRALALDGVFG